MNKKFQVFVSSTYKDLREERQAVVEAILMAGHIPAGMELFAAGDKSQLEIIRHWISTSDVFMLILGGRYGSIESETGKSYTQLEYEYALELGKPAFAAVISEAHLDRKVKTDGRSVLEETNHPLLKEFRKTVMTKICKFFEDCKDLKLIVHESIPEVTRGRELSGWVRGDDVVTTQVINQMNQLESGISALSRSVEEKSFQPTSDKQRRLDIARQRLSEQAKYGRDVETNLEMNNWVKASQSLVRGILKPKIAAKFQPRFAVVAGVTHITHQDKHALQMAMTDLRILETNMTIDHLLEIDGEGKQIRRKMPEVAIHVPSDKA